MPVSVFTKDEFSEMVIKNAVSKDMTYMDSLLEVVEERSLLVYKDDDKKVKSLVNPKLKALLAKEAEKLNLLKKT